MNFVDLFSGIGGFRLAAQWAGLEFEHEFHSDIDTYANRVYAKHFPNSVQLGDITKINWNEVKAGKTGEWILTGGFPCQPHSIAGKRKGSEDERDLWSECKRALSELRPRFAIFENVSGLFVSNGGEFFNRVLSDISEVGYDAEWGIIPASFVGAPHRRDRVWIVTYPHSRGGSGSQGLGEGDVRRIKSEEQNGNIIEAGERRVTPNSDVTEPRHNARTNSKAERDLRRGNESNVFTRSAEYVRHSESAGLKSGTNRQGQGEHGRTGERISWSGNHWTEIATRLCVVDDGVSNRLDRLKCLGNSIVPQVAQIIFECIKPHLQRKD